MAEDPRFPGLAWVACSREVSETAAAERHLIRPGAITTVCGSTASEPSIWRGNSRKPECKACVEFALLNRALDLLDSARCATPGEARSWSARRRALRDRRVMPGSTPSERTAALVTARGLLGDALFDGADPGLRAPFGRNRALILDAINAALAPRRSEVPAHA